MDIYNIVSGIGSTYVDIAYNVMPASAYTTPAICGTILWARKWKEINAMLRKRRRSDESGSTEDGSDAESDSAGLGLGLDSTSGCRTCRVDTPRRFGSPGGYDQNRTKSANDGKGTLAGKKYEAAGCSGWKYP